MTAKKETYTQYIKRKKNRELMDFVKRQKQWRKECELREICYLKKLIEDGKQLIEQLARDGGITDYVMSSIRLKAKRYERENYRHRSRSLYDLTWKEVVITERTIVLVKRELKIRSRRKMLSIDNKSSRMFFSSQLLASAIKQETKESTNGKMQHHF